MLSIAAARALPDGTEVTVEGVLTTALGALESGRTAFVEDGTAGIALYLDAAVGVPLPVGARIRATGQLDARFAQRTLRIAESDVVELGSAPLPRTETRTVDAGEALEGRRVEVEGTALSGQDALSDGLAVSIDDGSGPLRLIVTPTALDGRTIATGATIRAVGPLGQRDSTGTGTTGYRVFVVRPEDLVLTPPPTPTPSPTLAPTPTPTATPTATPSATPEPTATATATPTATPTTTPSPTTAPSPSPRVSPPVSWVPIGDARLLPIGRSVTVRGTVTADAGRLGTPSLIAIQDATGGLVVKLPDDVARPRRGSLIEVRGALADPYGQLEVRPGSTGSVVVLGSATLPTPATVSRLDETTEGRLVVITGRVASKPTKSTSGDIAFDLDTAAGVAVRIAADASSGWTKTTIGVDASVRLIGIAGQRATRKGALDGYRLWVRDVADLTRLAGPLASPSPSPTSVATPTARASASARPEATAARAVSIADALRATDRDVRIRAVVTAGADLLDASGRRIVVQDATGAVEVLLPSGVTAPSIGSRVDATGRVGAAYGSPRLRASAVVRLGTGSVPDPLVVRGAVTDAHAWRLITIQGRVDDTRKLGDRVRAEVVVGAQRIVVVAQAGAHLAASDLPEGATVSVTGIVRRAYPNATDRRPSVLPRSDDDVRTVAPAAPGGMTGQGASGAGADGSMSAGDDPAGGTAQLESETPDVDDADLADLAGIAGRTVRVGGLVQDLRPDGFTLDDGTAVGVIVLAGEAAELIPLIEPADAINVIGRVEARDEGVVLVVEDPATVVLGADLGEPSRPVASAAPTPSAVPAAGIRAAGFGDPIGGLPGAGAGLVSMALIALASVIVTVLRRRQAQARWQARVAARLTALAGPGSASDGAARPDRPAEGGLSVG